jgi:hypothetical protein
MTRPIESLQELQNVISAQITAGTSANSTLADQRRDLMDRYLAEPYPGDDNPDDEFSKVLSTDVADTVDAALPQIMEIFANGSPPGRFDAVGEEDEEAAEQESEVIHHVLMEKADGFAAIQTWLNDGLIQKNGYVKVWYDRAIEPQPPEVYQDVTDGQLMALMEDVGQYAEIISHTTKQMAVAGPDGMAQQISLHDISLKRYDVQEGVTWAAIPPEEIVVAGQWGKVTLTKCPFVAHVRPITRSMLVAMGFDPEQVDALSPMSRNSSSSEHSARFSRGVNETASAPADRSMEEIKVAECWLYADLDKDGIAELLHVFTGGGNHEVLKWKKDGRPAIEHVSRCGIVAWTPKPQSHRHIGQSLAEKAVQAQAVKTELYRQALDNIAINNQPRVEIAEDVLTENTIADYKASTKPGAAIRTRALGGMREIIPAPILGNTIPMMELVNSALEKQTGITAYNQGLDAESLNRTATGLSKIMNASQQKMQLVARNFANSLKEVYLIAHELLSKHSQRSLSIQLRGKWTDVHPAEWRRRTDMTIEVGVGSGNRAEQMAYYAQVLGLQKEALAAGSRLADEQGVFNTLQGLVRAAGLKDVRRYFNNPQEQPPQEPQGPTPEQQAAAMMAEMERAKLELQARKQAFDEQEAIARRDIDRDKFEGDFALRIMEMQSAMTETLFERLSAILTAPRDPVTGTTPANDTAAMAAAE